MRYRKTKDEPLLRRIDRNGSHGDSSGRCSRLDRIALDNTLVHDRAGVANFARRIDDPLDRDGPELGVHDVLLAYAPATLGPAGVGNTGWQRAASAGPGTGP